LANCLSLIANRITFNNLLFAICDLQSANITVAGQHPESHRDFLCLSGKVRKDVLKLLSIQIKSRLNEAPRAKARGLLERDTQAAIFHPCPQGQGFLAANV